MRIAYLGQMADVSYETSIAKKIRSQARAWMETGHEVQYFSLTPTVELWEGMQGLGCTLVSRGKIWERPGRSNLLCSRIAEWKPDLIYFRYAYHSSGFEQLFEQIPAVAEINSDDRVEYKQTLAWWKRAYHRLTRNRVLNPVKGFVCVTNELTARVAAFKKETRVIGNAIDLANHPQLPPADGTQPIRLAFMGSHSTPWHGIDRMGELARLFPEWQLDLIGCTETDWRQISTALPPKNLHFHGHLGREDYLPMLTRTVAAIGTLGLYRKSMQEACPLKVREYLALGLPVIGGCLDTDIPGDADYYLRLPNSGASLEPWRDRIGEFVGHWRHQRVPRIAISHLDTLVKEQQRLEFMAQILRESNRLQ